MRRWFGSLQAQLLLWAVLPVTFVIIALAFTGVYAHQRTMRDFVAERDTTLARVTARLIAEGLGRGAIDPSGEGLEDWMPALDGGRNETLLVVDGGGRVLAQLGPASEALDPAVARAIARRDQREGALIVARERGDGEQLLLAYAPVRGTDWLVVVQEPVEGLIGPILRLTNLGPVVAAGAGVLSLLVLSFGWRTIVRPLQALSDAAGQVSWGNYAAITEPVGGVQEVRDLHGALTEMVARIQGYQAGMQDYLGAVTEGQEAERTRLAQELHDGPVQDLIALAQQAEIGQRSVERGEVAEARALLEEMRRAELRVVEELRRMIGALRPVYLEDLGFIPALDMLVRQAAERTPAEVRMEQAGTGPRCPAEIELAAYRIAQEALTNAIQHAQAQQIVVGVRCDADGLVLSVVDDGVGFSVPANPHDLTHAGHFGLVGMRERALSLGGSFQVESAPGAGTRIVVRLPRDPRMD